MIEIKDTSKSISGKLILDNINLLVHKGSIFGLIGPNGAGKTTLIRCLTGIYKIDTGNIKILGEEIFDNKELKSKIGYVSDQNNFYGNFKIKYMVEFFSKSYKTFSIEKFKQLNEIFKINENSIIRNLSKGMKMRLSIMLNFSIMPEILIMDEPTSGLDPIAKRQVMNLIVEDVSQRNTTVFISSHNLNEIERICDNIAIIENGKIKCSNSLENLKKNIRKFQVVFNNEAPNDLKNWPEILNVSKIGRVYYIVTNNYDSNFENKLKDGGASFIEEIDLSLEDIFIYSTGGIEYVK